MDIAALSMQESLRSLQSALSMTTLKKSMNQDVQAATVLLNDMMVANPAPSPRGIGAKLNVTA